MDAKTTPCKGCGKPVVFAMDTEGKIQCLDPAPPVYGHISTATNGDPLVRRILGGAVSHFATCPSANLFSKASKKKNEETPS